MITNDDPPKEDPKNDPPPPPQAKPEEPQPLPTVRDDDLMKQYTKVIEPEKRPGRLHHNS